MHTKHNTNRAEVLKRLAITAAMLDVGILRKTALPDGSAVIGKGPNYATACEDTEVKQDLIFVFGEVWER